MFLQNVTVAVRDGQESAFEAALCEVRQRVFMSAGFRGFSVVQGAEQPWTYLVRIRWESADEAADVVDSGRFERCWAPVDAFLAGPLRVEHFVERPTLDLVGPGVLTDLEWLRD